MAARWPERRFARLTWKYRLISIALLIFGYGIYELMISGIDPRLDSGEEHHTNIHSVNSL